MKNSSKEGDYCYTFTAARGVQAGKPFYIAVCPLRIIPKIFVFDDGEIPPELRAQRTLNKSRIPEMANYILDNQNDYVFSALTASVDAKVHFEPLSKNRAENNIGQLSIPMDARILINDGQHRRAAIEEAINQNSELGHDNIAVLFFTDEGLKRSQQMFADLNKYAIRPSTSLGVLYDHRNDLSGLARYLAMKATPFVGLVEMEKSSLSHRSVKLFTLSAIRQANKALFNKKRNAAIEDDESKIAVEYWEAVAKNIPDWGLVKQRKLPAVEARQQYIHSHGVALYALGIVGNSLLSEHSGDWKKILTKLKQVKWSRDEKCWQNRTLIHGKVSKSLTNVALTANVIKKHLGLKLTAHEKQLEKGLSK